MGHFSGRGEACGTRLPSRRPGLAGRRCRGRREAVDLDALGMTRLGQAAKTRATSSGAAPCAPTPGARNSACALARSSSGSMRAGPTTAPTGPICPAASMRFSFPISAEQPVIDLAALVAEGGLDSSSFQVGGTGYDQQAAPGLVRHARRRRPSPPARDQGWTVAASASSGAPGPRNACSPASASRVRNRPTRCPFWAGWRNRLSWLTEYRVRRRPGCGSGNQRFPGQRRWPGRSGWSVRRRR